MHDKTFSYTPKWIWLLALVGPLLPFLVALFVRQQATVGITLCRDCDRRWFVTDVFFVGHGLLGFLAWPIFGGLIGRWLEPSEGAIWGVVAGLVVWAVGLLVLRLFAVGRYQAVCAYITSVNVHLEFPDVSLVRRLIGEARRSKLSPIEVEEKKPELPLAPLGVRAKAYGLDFLLLCFGAGTLCIASYQGLVSYRSWVAVGALGGGVFLLYLIVQWTLLIRTSASFGKRLLGLQIVNSDGSQVDLFGLVVRQLAHKLWVLTFIGGNAPSWHDRVAKTRVVVGTERGISPPNWAAIVFVLAAAVGGLGLAQHKASQPHDVNEVVQAWASTGLTSRWFGPSLEVAEATLGASDIPALHAAYDASPQRSAKVIAGIASREASDCGPEIPLVVELFEASTTNKIAKQQLASALQDLSQYHGEARSALLRQLRARDPHVQAIARTALGDASSSEIQAAAPTVRHTLSRGRLVVELASRAAEDDRAIDLCLQVGREMWDEMRGRPWHEWDEHEALLGELVGDLDPRHAEVRGFWLELIRDTHGGGAESRGLSRDRVRNLGRRVDRWLLTLPPEQALELTSDYPYAASGPLKKLDAGKRGRFFTQLFGGDVLSRRRGLKLIQHVMDPPIMVNGRETPPYLVVLPLLRDTDPEARRLAAEILTHRSKYERALTHYYAPQMLEAEFEYVKPYLFRHGSRIQTSVLIKAFRQGGGTPKRANAYHLLTGRIYELQRKRDAESAAHLKEIQEAFRDAKDDPQLSRRVAVSIEEWLRKLERGNPR